VPHDLVCLGDHIFRSDLQIRERRAHSGDDRLVKETDELGLAVFQGNEAQYSPTVSHGISGTPHRGIIVETIFLVEEKHPHSVLFFQDPFLARQMSPTGPSGHLRRGAKQFL
jgi:hypothetical protein